jgi:multisubunit Na+/H+ antiporter MnhC subunit
MSALPPQRPLRQSLLLSAVVIAVTALAAVVLWALTSWLWLVVHQGLH